MRKIGLLKFGLAVLLLGGVFGSYVALSGQGNNPVIAENVLAFAVGDVNSDSYPDIVAAVTASPQTHNLKLFLNHNGSFSDASSLLSIIPPAPESPAVASYIIKLANWLISITTRFWILSSWAKRNTRPATCYSSARATAHSSRRMSG
jgi:hypothetical protein